MEHMEKKSKIKRIYFRFSLIEGKERDMKVLEFLNSIPKPLRGELIIEGIRLVMDAFSCKKQPQKGFAEHLEEFRFKGSLDI
jgi:hypothetical protein